MKKIALILAGGRGERFWPKSRKRLPKQFLTLVDSEKTMLQLAVERVLPVIDIKDIYIVTDRLYKAIVMEQIQALPEENIICEPLGKNTAPCICLAAMYISKKYDNSVMFVFPSDHLIRDNTRFLSALNKAYDVVCDKDAIATIGIMPSHPETGYGYIKTESETGTQDVYIVEKFDEKPNMEKAVEYVSSAGYLWNSGMFVWKTKTILEKLQQYLPEVYKEISSVFSIEDKEKQMDILEQVYGGLPSISIDYAILEKTDNIYVIQGSFVWDDVGSWLALERIKKENAEGNVLDGDVVSIKTSNCIIQGMDKLIAAVGLKNVVIVESQDAILVCDKQHTADVKRVIERLADLNKEKYL